MNTNMIGNENNIIFYEDENGRYLSFKCLSESDTTGFYLVTEDCERTVTQVGEYEADVYISNNDAAFMVDATKTSKCDLCDATNTIVDEGSMLTVPANDGWYQVNVNWYYYENGAKVTNAWRADGAGKCYLTEDGTVLKM